MGLPDLEFANETVEATESMHEEEVNLLSLPDSIQIYFVNFDMVLKKRIVISSWSVKKDAKVK